MHPTACSAELLSPRGGRHRELIGASPKLIERLAVLLPPLAFSLQGLIEVTQCASEVAAVGGVIFTMAGLVQSAAADPIYHLEAGAEYSVASGVGTFIIPSVAEGLLFYLDADDPPTEITLTGLYHSDDKVSYARKLVTA
jgi:hypothetical protein